MDKSKHYLYSFRRCPYAMRARMALVMADIPFVIEEVDFKSKPQEMLDISPKGTVPVLQTNEGRVIDESIEIVQWALGDDWNHVDQALVQDNDAWFKAALDRYKYPTRYPEEDTSGAKEKGEEFIRKLEGIVDPEKQTMTDICIFPFVRQFAHVDRKWFYDLPNKNVQAWLSMNIESPLFKTIFNKKFEGFTPS